MKEIVQENEEVFSFDKETKFNKAHGEFTLLLRLIYEKSLGKSSYWYPYLNLLTDVKLTSQSWSPEEIDMLENPNLKRLILIK